MGNKIKKLLIILGLIIAVNFTIAADDSHALINLQVWGPMSYWISPDAGSWNELTFMNLNLQATYNILPNIGLGLQTGFWWDLTHDDWDEMEDIPLLFLADINVLPIIIQAGGGFYMRSWGSAEETDFGMFAGLFYPIKVAPTISIPLGTQMHFVFADNDTIVLWKFGAGIRVEI